MGKLSVNKIKLTRHSVALHHQVYGSLVLVSDPHQGVGVHSLALLDRLIIMKGRTTGFGLAHRSAEDVRPARNLRVEFTGKLQG